MYYYILMTVFSIVYAANEKADFKNQFCTDPRTFKKHPAYSEWADAYSCTRHRCQPGGRSLAIYTVGCKRVEPPEAAIECEEVVEDTNMQFPFCCTRLRCLVIVRGEVWTKVLGQPWENLPAAPWSHMYKMKRPPPGGQAYLPKDVEGPVYELMTESPKEKKMRSSANRPGADPDCPECEMRSTGTRISPDIVIALTAGEEKGFKRSEDKANKYAPERTSKSDEDSELEKAEAEFEDKRESKGETETKEQRAKEIKIKEKKEKPRTQHSEPQWTEIPQSQWVDNDSLKTDSKEPEPEKSSSPYNLQSLVDAISTRMRDIENVVQKMSEKVTNDGGTSGTTGTANRKDEEDDEDSERRRAQGEMTDDATTEASIEDSLSSLYSNKLGTRRKPPTEPSQFMAPIETGKKTEKRHHHKKHTHIGRIHKKTRRNKKLKKGVNMLSLEDSRMT